MKNTWILILFLLMPYFLLGQVKVKGYYRKDGTYVQPHYRSSPNTTKSDNWSTKGNVNPYTSKVGNKNVDPINKNKSIISSQEAEKKWTAWKESIGDEKKSNTLVDNKIATKQFNDITPFEKIFRDNIKIDDLTPYFREYLTEMIGEIELNGYNSNNALGLTSCVYKSIKHKIYEYKIIVSADPGTKKVMVVNIITNDYDAREGVVNSLRSKNYSEINTLLAKSEVDYYFVGDTNPARLPTKESELKDISIATVNMEKNELAISFWGRK